MTIEFMRSSDSGEVSELPRISVIGVGGGGGNAVANMIASDVQGVDFIVANTDAQALNISPAEQRIQLGPTTTQGLGAGSRPEVGKAAAEETIEQIQEAIEGARMCFIAAGMGGGTGTGAAPVIAKVARDRGILTVGVVTKPFNFEGKRRARAAESGIEELQKHVDTLIVIPNQNLFLIANPNTTFKQAFQMADEVLQQGVRGITDLMVRPGLINLDFADIRSVMSEMGKAMMGTGEASGDNRAIEAAEKAIANPLLDGVSMNGARGVIVSIIGGEDMTLMEVDEAATHIKELVDSDANIIFGSAFNEDLDGRIRVSVVATGIDSSKKEEGEDEKSYSNPTSSVSGYSSMSSPAASSMSQPSAHVAAPAPKVAAPQPPVEDELVLGKEAVSPTEKKDNAKVSPTPSSDNGENAAQAGWNNEPNRPAPRLVREGSTLFERMSNIARGNDRKDNTENRGRVDIPQFLNRQGNS
ncbi:MAG: cell division protein FtsZ [Zymomonas mobilis]|uniref:Cell division protein FtsZ n=1 Tax=Zymomonas mobilis TaxID=542 RepID=A0A542W106_ZYMMB|nr:cell division protein FtsZ [Zymomonas mobilis]TQL17262.1 cell division protein FtsZ [Zymomonas mobilis]